MTKLAKVLYGNVADVNDQQSSSGSAYPLYRALKEKFDMVGSIDASLNSKQKRYNDVINFHFNFKRWKESRHKSIKTLNLHSKVASTCAAEYEGEYDFYFQQRALFDPREWCDKPYSIYTDCTHYNTLRFWPEWSPFSENELAQWLEREKKIYDGAALLFPWSEFAAKSMIDDYGQDPAKVIVVGSGINFSPLPAAHGAYDNKTILFIGYDFERKGGPQLLKAFELVKKTISDAQLIIAGPKQVNHSGTDNITWLGTLNNRAEVSELYRKASVFVLPSQYEPWGSVYLEAMAHGLPCIALDRAAAPEIITNGIDGALASCASPEAIAEQIIIMLSDKSRLNQCGNHARNKVMTHFTWESVVERISTHILRSVNE